jgi:hypothetical protein
MSANAPLTTKQLWEQFGIFAYTPKFAIDTTVMRTHPQVKIGAIRKTEKGYEIIEGNGLGQVFKKRNEAINFLTQNYLESLAG